LTGENVLPLEDEIANAAKKYFPGFQHEFSALGVELSNLHLTGATRADDLSSDLTDIVRGDGSDAVGRLGGPDSPIFDSLKWARKVKQAFANGLKQVIASLQELDNEIRQLPDSGVPGQLKTNAVDRLAQVKDILAKENFYDEFPTLQTALHELNTLVASVVGDIAKQQSNVCEREVAKWQALPDWTDLLPEDRTWFTSEVEKLKVDAPQTLAGLRQLIAHEYSLNYRLRELETHIAIRGGERRRDREKPETPGIGTPPEPPETFETDVAVPAVFDTVEQLDVLVGQIQGFRPRIAARQRVRIRFKERT
jgi:hypothetical protein